MTKLLEQAIERVRGLPEAEQDVAADVLFSAISRNSEPVELDEETRTAIKKSLAQAERGEFVSDEDMQAFWKRQGL